MAGLETKFYHLLKRTPLFSYAEQSRETVWHRRYLKKCSFTQNGEDSFLFEYFQGNRAGSYIDVGANHPFIGNNTYLLYRNGWTGVTIEPIPRLSQRHAHWRPRDVRLNCAVSDAPGKLRFFECTPSGLSTFDEKLAETRIQSGAAILVECRDIEILTLSEVCKRYFPAQVPNVLSIDVEGLDMKVLQGMNWDVRPDLIVVETATLGAVPMTEDVAGFLRSKSYRLIRQVGINSFFERSVASG